MVQEQRQFGMTTEELQVYFAGMGREQVLRQLRKWGARARMVWPVTPAERLRPGELVCDRHWSEVKASFRTDNPINAVSVAIGLATAMYLGDMPIRPTRHACCLLNDHAWKGVLARSRRIKEVA